VPESMKRALARYSGPGSGQAPGGVWIMAYASQYIELSCRRAARD
jgi:hypothetical protein